MSTSKALIMAVSEILAVKGAKEMFTVTSK